MKTDLRLPEGTGQGAVVPKKRVHSPISKNKKKSLND